MKGPQGFAPEMIRRLWIAFAGVLLACAAAELWLPHKNYFGIAGLPLFYAGFGFLSCVVLVVVAKALGVMLKRRDNYYER